VSPICEESLGDFVYVPLPGIRIDGEVAIAFQ